METQLTDKEEGRLNYLMGKHCYVTKETIQSFLTHPHKGYVARKRPEYEERLEAHLLLDKKGLTEEQKNVVWVKSNWSQRKKRLSYKAKPKRVRQDNKTEINYSHSGGGCNVNRIRYPKKNRKTAWKRFYKLFPHLKPE